MTDKLLDAINDGESRIFTDWLQIVKDDRADWPWHRKLRMNFRWKVAQPVRNFPREVRWFIQRGRRGWSDYDLWGMDTYLARVNVDMLTELRRVAHGYPPELEGDDGFEKWLEILDEIKAGWEAYLKMSDIETDWEESQAEFEKFKAMMPTYTRWYPGLWD